MITLLSVLESAGFDVVGNDGADDVIATKNGATVHITYEESVETYHIVATRYGKMSNEIVDDLILVGQVASDLVSELPLVSEALFTDQGGWKIGDFITSATLDGVTDDWVLADIDKLLDKAMILGTETGLRLKLKYTDLDALASGRVVDVTEEKVSLLRKIKGLFV